MNLCVYLCKTEPLKYGGSVSVYFIFAVIASIISSLLYVGFSAGEISASPIVPTHSTDNANGKETSPVSFADCTAAKSKLPSEVLPPNEITALIFENQSHPNQLHREKQSFHGLHRYKNPCRRFFKSGAVRCTDIPVNIAHVNKSAAELLAELCGFSSSLSVIFSHTVTAISAGEKQAVFSDIISAARSREMVSSPDLQTFSLPTLASLLKPNLPYVQMIFPFAGSHLVIELPLEKHLSRILRRSRCSASRCKFRGAEHSF